MKRCKILKSLEFETPRNHKLLYHRTELLSRAAMPKLVSLDTIYVVSVYSLCTNLASSSRSAVAATRRIKTKQQCSVVSDGNKQAIRWRLSYETHQQATNAIQSRDLERGRVLCSKQKVERGKSTHPSFANLGHRCFRAILSHLRTDKLCCYYVLCRS